MSVANELRAYREYPNHPLFSEGPWHLTPDGRFTSATDFEAEVTVESSPIGQRIRLEGPFEESRRAPGDPAVVGRRSGRADDVAPRLPRPRPPVPGPVPGRRRGRRAGVGGRQRRHRPAVRAAQRRRRGGPVHARSSGLQLVRAGRDRPGRARGRRRTPPMPRRRAPSRAIGVAEVVVPDDPRQDAAVRDLVIALVRQGVTSTLVAATTATATACSISTPTSPTSGLRSGVPRRTASSAPSSMPPIARLPRRARAAAGRPGLGPRCGSPRSGARSNAREPIPDLRGARDLPVLIVAGVDPDATTRALEALSADLEDGVIAVDQPAELDGATGQVEDYTVAILNRGMPGFNVEAGRQPVPLAHAVVQRLALGRLDRPAAAGDAGRGELPVPALEPPFEYARRGRRRGLARRPGSCGPDTTTTIRSWHACSTAIAGRLPATTSLIEVEPRVRGHDRPEAGRRRGDADGRDGRRSRCTAIALRLYESSGRPTTATIRSRWPIASAGVTNILEEEHAAAGSVGDDGRGPARAVRDRDGRGNAGGARRRGSVRTADSPRAARPAQPVFSDYWLHNKGAGADGLPGGHRADQAVVPERRRAVRAADRRGLRAHGRRGRGFGRR